MKLTITIDVPEILALELVPKGALGPYGEGSVKASAAGSVVVTGPSGLAAWLLKGSEPIDAELTRELTPAERKAKLDAEHFDEEFS